MNKFERYYEAVRFLEGLSNIPSSGDYQISSRNLGHYLKRMRSFLNMIGSPDKNINYVHVTGTAGKGTVVNMVHEIMNSSGINVGSFTSPFVTTSIEKIRVGKEYISPNDFADIVEYLKTFIDKAYLTSPYGKPSYFEIFLAIAFVYFKRKNCDWVILEVGLGGRYDATNVIEKPKVTAITTIDYDHTNVLGKTLREIAYDKSGIIKSGSKFFTAEQRPTILKIFNKACKEEGVEMIRISKQSDYMKYNLDLASAITREIGISEFNINKGISLSSLQCRFETMQKNPTVILDGAHNRSKIRSTVLNLKNMKLKKLHLIIGIAESKDDIQILSEIVPFADKIYFTRFQIKDRKCAHPKSLAERSEKYLKNRVDIAVFLDPNVAMNSALSEAKEDDLILVAGSFFLAGEMRKRWIPEESILKSRKGFKN